MGVTLTPILKGNDMAIEKKLIHFGKLADFEAQLTAGNILDYSIVFIQDAKKIWTHSTYYDCTEGGASGDELWYVDSEGNAFCDRDIRVDGNVLTNGTVVTGSIGVPLEEGGFVTGDKGQILRANGDGSIGWDDISIPTKVSQLENDRNFVDEQTLSEYVKKETFAGLDTAQASAISGGGMLYALPDQANGGEDDILLSRDSVKTINGESILGEGDLTIESGAKIYVWFYEGESESVTLSQEEYDNIVNADIVVVNLGGILSCVVNKSGKEFAEAVGYYGLTGQVDMQGSKMLIDISINISTKLATITLTPQDIPTKTSQLENDSNFITSDGLKTINGESILGSGDITISGGGSSGGSGAYSEVNHGTSDTTFTLTPNTFHIWDEVANLTLTLGSETSGVANEYLFQFTSGATATSLTLPDDIKWANDSAPTIVENMIYQVSILNGLASVLEFSNAPALIDNKATVSISGTKYLVSLQYAAASDIIVKVRTIDGAISVSILSDEISKSASGMGPMMDSGAYIESITPTNDTTYNYIW